MPTNTFTFGDQGAFSITQLSPISAAAPAPLGGTLYQFMIWYPVIELIQVPDYISKDLRWYGDKHYLGEIAFLNFGAVVSTQFLQFPKQQFQTLLALPVPLFETGNTSEQVNVFNQGFYTGVPRARDIAWELRPGVRLRVDVRWLIGDINYSPEFNNFSVI